ncbi:MAG: PAS domain S-box protein [Fimbriimonadaceae bacterium]
MDSIFGIVPIRSFLACVAMLAIGLVASAWAWKEIDRQYRRQFVAVASHELAHLSPQDFDGLAFRSDEVTHPTYRATRKKLWAIQDRVRQSFGPANAKLTVYTVLLDPAGARFGPEAILEGDPLASRPGTVYQQVPAVFDRALAEDQAQIAGPTRDEYGSFVTVAKRISRERPIVVAMDVAEQDWNTAIFTRVLPIFAFSFALAALIFVGAVARCRRRVQPKPLLRRLLPILTVSSFLLIFGGLLVYKDLEIRRMIAEESDRHIRIVSDLHLELQTEAEHLQSLLGAVVQAAGIADGIQEGDRESLLREWTEQFKVWNRTLEISRLTFVDAHGRCIARVHLPEHYGDIIVREGLKTVAATRAPAAGVDIGYRGTLALRAVQPVLKNGNLVGYVILGKEIGSILERVHETSAGELAVTVSKDHLDRGSWEAAMHRLGVPAEWDRMPHRVVAFSTMGRLPDALVRVANHHPQTGLANGAVTDLVASGDRKWRWRMSPLPDSTGKEIACLMTITDATAREALLGDKLAMGTSIGTILLAVILAFTFFVLKRADLGIFYQTKDLEQSREAYRRLFTDSSSIKLLLDPQSGRILDANKSASVFFGVEATDLVARSVAELTENGHAAVGAMLEHARSGSKSPFACRQRGAQGDWRDVEIYLSLIDQGGQEVLDAIVHDVTRRKQAERQVEEERTRLANVIEGTNAGIWEWKMDTDALHVNERWAEMLGTSLAELGPMTSARWEAMVHPDDRERVREILQRHVADPGSRYEVEYRMRHRDGHWVWILANGRIVERAPDGTPFRMFGTHSDISGRKAAEETLRIAQEDMQNAIVEANEMAVAAAAASEALEYERANLEAIFNSSNIALMIVDDDLKIARANHQAGVLAATHPDLLVDRHFGDVIQCAHRQGGSGCGSGTECQTCAIRLAIRRTISRGKTVSNFDQELIMTRQTPPTRMWASITTSPVNLAGRRLAVLAVLDITESHSAVDALKEREEAFRALFERSMDPILIMRDGRFVNCNEAAVQALGLSNKNEVFSLRPEDISPETQPNGRNSAELAAEMVALARKNGHHRFEWVHQQLNGGPFPVEVMLTLMRIGGEEHFHVSWRDIAERKRFEEAIVAAHKELDEYFNSSLDLFCIADTEGRFVRVNPQWEAALGYPVAELEGRRFLDFVHPDDVEETIATFGDIISGSSVDGFENRYRCKDGSYRWIEWRSRPVDGRIYAAARDVTERRAMIKAVADAERRYRTLIENSQSIIYTITPQGTLTFVSPSWKTLLGHEPSEIVGQNFLDLVHEDEVPVCGDFLRSILRDSNSQIAVEYRIRHRDGTWRWHRSIGTSVATDDGFEFVGNAIDITERKNAEAALVRYTAELQEANATLEIMANRDPLTGLVNRRRFLEVVARQFEAASLSGETFALMFIDLDNFKYVNDSLGHDAGDRLLCDVAEVLLTCVGPKSTVSRLGGDEFAVLLEAPHSVGDAEAIASRIVRMLETPIDIGGNAISATCSVGIVGSESGSSTEELIQNADTAMYYAKHAGKSRWRTFQPFMTEEVQARLDLEADLRQAWEAREFTLNFQPLVNLDSGVTEEVEVLLRWDSERRGRVSPAEFIPLAEEINLIESLGAWVLEEACAKAVRWHAEIPGAEHVRIAVNVSGKQIRMPGFAVDVRRILERTGLPPSYLTIEVTETMIITDGSANLAQLQALRDMGVRVAIDDFGTGYSSMGSLASLPVDAVKIDRSFVSLLGNNVEATAIMRALVNLCQVLNLEVVAEGVETEDQRVQSQALGCRMAQGYFFAKPMRETELADWFAEGNNRQPKKQPGRTGRDAA